MKRSEMHKLMCNTWRDYCQKMGPDNAGVGNAMEAVLTAIEEVGMQPPLIESDIYLRSECDYVMVHEWEPEDGE